MAQLPAEARLTVVRKTDKMPCGLWEDKDGDARVTVDYGCWIDDLPGEHQQYLDTVRGCWEDRGYRKVSGDADPDPRPAKLHREGVVAPGEHRCWLQSRCCRDGIRQ